MKCEGLTSQLKACGDKPQEIAFDKKADVIGVARYKSANQASEGNPFKLVEAEKRAGGKRSKRDITQPPSGPDSKDVLDDSATKLIYQEKM